MTKDRKNRSNHPRREDDDELWSKVTEGIRPLRRPPGAKPVSDAFRTGDLRNAATEKPKRKQSGGSDSARPENPLPPAASPAGAPPLTGIDRRTRQKLARGNTQIDGRMDLHGLGKESARTALMNFLAVSRAAGKRTVLVITGKGYSPYSSHTLHGYEHVNTPERHGVIRRALPQWLDEPEFRLHVAGYQPAHPRHGGGGAFYIRLRRQKE